jgi:hypothetical protein
MAKEPTNINHMNKLVNNVIAEAEKEINDEIVKKCKTKLVAKLREQKQAARLLNNINREIEEIKLEMGHDLEG